MSEKNTIGNIFAQLPGDKQNPAWVNGPFEAVMSNPQMRIPKSGGNPFFTCMLGDPANPAWALNCTFFGQAITIPAGMVEVSGGGMQLTEYNGAKQITCGSKASIRSLGGSGLPELGTPVPNQVAVTQQYAPADRGYGVQPTQVSAPVHGATVGMAINNGIEILLNLHHQDASFFNSDEFAKDLWKVASQIVRTSQAIEGGKLAGKFGERVEVGELGAPIELPPVPVAPVPVVAPVRKARGPDGSVGDLDLGDSVPF